jgi:hypothetical protein
MQGEVIRYYGRWGKQWCWITLHARGGGGHGQQGMQSCLMTIHARHCGDIMMSGGRLIVPEHRTRNVDDSACVKTIVGWVGNSAWKPEAPVKTTSEQLRLMRKHQCWKTAGGQLHAGAILLTNKFVGQNAHHYN